MKAATEEWASPKFLILNPPPLSPSQTVKAAGDGTVRRLN